MNYEKILELLNAPNIPVYGIHWNPPRAEVELANSVIQMLNLNGLIRTREWLEYHLPAQINSYYEQWVYLERYMTTGLHPATRNIGEICENLKQVFQAEIQPMEGLTGQLEAIIAACHRFDMANETRRRTSGLESQATLVAIGEFLSTVGYHVGVIAVMYGIDLESSDLLSILPPSTE